jgi:hypothetical protein
LDTERESWHPGGRETPVIVIGQAALDQRGLVVAEPVVASRGTVGKVVIGVVLLGHELGGRRWGTAALQ